MSGNAFRLFQLVGIKAEHFVKLHIYKKIPLTERWQIVHFK